jgi:hypothetical protein
MSSTAVMMSAVLLATSYAAINHARWDGSLPGFAL